MSLPNACPKPGKREKVAKKPAPRKRMRSAPPKVRDRAYLDWIKTQNCIVFSRLGPSPCRYWTVSRPSVEPAHVKTKGSGGADRGNVVPLCPRHHDEQEGDTEGFEQVYGVNLKLAAAELLVAYIKAGEP